MVSRRQVLVTGGASLLLLGGGFAGYVGTRSIAQAREPWKQAAEGFGDARLDALAYAVLAPNPHNLQPWQVRLEGDDAFTLYCDPQRRLPETDPPNRQITIGLGAFLELFRQAAAEKGYRADITPFPEGEPQPVLDNRPIASVVMVPDGDVRPDPLFSVALDRRTARVPYSDKPVPQNSFAQLGTAALSQPDLTGGISFAGTSDAKEVAWHRDIHTRAWKVELETPKTHGESIKWMRVGAAEVNANPDGISLHGPVMEGAGALGILSAEGSREPGSTGFEGTRDFYNSLIDTAQGFGWIVSAGNSRVQQLQTGGAWVRIHQAATQRGLAMHPLSQLLQEFPEMQGLYDEFHNHLGISAPARVQGLLRFGYAAQPEPAPRWPLQSKIIES